MSVNTEHLFSANVQNLYKINCVKFPNLHNLRLYHIGLTTPIMDCNLLIPTEASNHNGTPHVLEHLTFLGSRDWPFKGVLDLLANRCFSDGTNAFTAKDLTCYTLNCAGAEGFCRLLPVYLDHVLRPLLNKSGFITEVHHINAKGEDAGVVYSEMQGSQNTGSSLTYHTMMETLFEGSGLACNTGGRIEDIRSNLTLEEVQNFHQAFYHPQNMSLIIAGQIELDRVIESISPYLKKLESQYNLSPRATHAWNTPIPALQQTVQKTVRFPSSDDETTGMIYCGWQSAPFDSYFTITALNILLKYLTSSSVAPLRQEFVERDEAWCGDVSSWVGVYRTCAIFVAFQNVEVEYLDRIPNRLVACLKRIVGREESEDDSNQPDFVTRGIDMKRMKTLIKRARIRHLSSLEEDASETLMDYVVEHALYGEYSQQSLTDYIDDSSRYEQLLLKDEAFWISLIEEYMLNRPHVAIMGRPDRELGEEMGRLEKDRISKQREQLGEERLTQLGKQLEEAEKNNNPPISPETFEAFPIPSVESIPSVPVMGFRTDIPIQEQHHDTPLAKYITNDLGDSKLTEAYPWIVQFNHYKSSFVNCCVWMDTETVPLNLRPYIELYLEVQFELPIRKKDGKYLTHDDVVHLLTSETVSYANGVGDSGSSNFVCGPFSQLAQSYIKVEKSKYQKMLDWMEDILTRSEFTAKRLTIGAQKLIKDAQKSKRLPSMVGSAALKWFNFESESNHRVCNFIRQLHFLKHVAKRLKSEPDKVIQEVNQFRQYLLKSLRIHIYGDILSIERPAHLLTQYQFSIDSKDASYKQPSVIYEHERVKHQALTTSEQPKSCPIFGISSTDSSYMIQSCNGIKDYQSSDYAALLVLIELFVCTEGPLWKQVRGKGLAYHYGINANCSQGLIYFRLSKSADVVQAYEESKRIIEQYYNKEVEFKETDLEAAKSGVIFALTTQTDTTSSAATLHFYHTLRGLPENHVQNLLLKIERVTLNDLRNCLTKYLWQLFDERQSACVLVTNSSKVKDIQKDFAKWRELKQEKIDQFFH